MNDPRLKNLFNCIDNTTLGGTDSTKSVEKFCAETVKMCNENIGHVASVCVYPKHVATAKNVLKGTPVRVASVAGGFPAGQLPPHLKIEEVRYAVEQGADEIDYVINRGDFLSGNENLVFEEVSTAKKVCGNSLLKVIIETGELESMDNIYRASMLVMQAGADFIKTSTGKIAVGATIEAANVMLSAIADFQKKYKKLIGFKAAGGISTVEQALSYMQLAEKLYGTKNINKQYFRIGTSRLTQQIFKNLTF